jgi:hypothetical protein
MQTGIRTSRRIGFNSANSAQDFEVFKIFKSEIKKIKNLLKGSPMITLSCRSNMAGQSPAADVLDRSGKFTSRIVDTGGKFAFRIVDTGGKFTPVSTIPVVTPFPRFTSTLVAYRSGACRTFSTSANDARV